MENQPYIDGYYTSSFGNIYYRLRKGDSNSWISFLHGYPTSSLDYVHLFSRIPKQYNVIVHDYLGFGKSDKPIDNDYLLVDQATIACELYESLGINNPDIVAHDYGTSVATELLARLNSGNLKIDINSMTICNGSILIDMSQLRLIQKLLKHKWIGPIVAKFTTAHIFHRNMKNIWYNKHLYNKPDFDPHWEALISNNGKKVLPKITTYIDQRYANYDRWVGALKAVKIPVHILWAADDPVAIVEMAYKLKAIAEAAKLTIIEECGHYPMIEKEIEWLDNVVSFIEDQHSFTDS